MEEKLANYLLDNFKITRVNKTYVVVDGQEITRAKFLETHVKIKTLQEAGCIEVADYPDTQKKAFLKKVLDAVGTFLRDDFYESRQAKDLPEAKIDRTQLVPLLDVKTDNVILYNNVTKSVSEMSFKAWLRKMSEDDRGLINNLMRDAVFVYDPYDLETFVPVDFEGMSVLKVNTYAPPKWRFRPDPGELEVECPEIIQRVLEHIFPDPKCRRFVLNWAFQALMSRNETYLVLNGPKGLGKGVFTDIMAALVGHKQFSKVPVGFFTKEFNAVLDKKRLIMMDEIKVGKEEHTRLKNYANKLQNIEKKGIDADRAVETFNSYIINNNDLSDMHLEPDDRRFAVPDMCMERLDSVITRAEIAQLYRELENEDSDLIYQFGYYIFHYGKAPELDVFDWYAGKRFWDLCYTSLKDWERFLVDKVLSREAKEYELVDLVKDHMKENMHSQSKFPRNYRKVSEFLLNYWHEGRTRIGRIEDGEHGNKMLLVESEFWPDVSLDEEIL